VRTTNITRHSTGQTLQKITALARAYIQGQSEKKPAEDLKVYVCVSCGMDWEFEN